MRHLALAALLAACTHAAAPTGGTLPAVPLVASGDTLRGIIGLTGVIPATRLVIRRNGDGPAIPLSGDTALLRSVVGLDVRLFGEWSGKGYVVSEFVVRAVGGVPAIDGEIRFGGSGVLLRNSLAGFRKGANWIDTFVELRDPPDGLLEHPSARVWVTLARDGTVASYGFIPTPPAGPR